MMRHLLFLLVFLCGFSGVSTASAEGLRYYGNDPYAVLNEAQKQRKMLLVEFYAPWNYKSRWMNENVLGHASMRGMIEEHFLPVQVLTDTEDGGKLAAVYQVTDYPAIVIFSANGDVLDKIDKPLDRDDFRKRMEALFLVTGGGNMRWLNQAYAAAEAGDIENADVFAGQYLRSQTPEQVINSVVWPMFQNSQITYYYSSAFDYLLAHIGRFRDTIGLSQVNDVVSEILVKAMLGYVVGSAAYDSAAMSQIAAIAGKEGLLVAGALRSAAEIVQIREEGNLALYVARLSLLLDQFPESMQFQMAMTLEIVAEKGTRDERKAAADIIASLITAQQTSSNIMILEKLLERLK